MRRATQLQGGPILLVETHALSCCAAGVDASEVLMF